MGSAYLETVLAKLKEFEGCVPWMYLDTVGKVTVGIGLMLPSGPAADALPFVIGDRAATTAEIAKEFARVSGMEKGRVAKFYARTGGLRLTQEAIDTKLRSTLEGFEGYLRRYLPMYDSLPDAAKVALLDMVYNLGPGRLFAEYPRLIAAIEAGDWKAAAAASARRGPSPARNLWTKQQLLDAAKAVVSDVRAATESNTLRWIMAAVAGLAAAALALVIYDEARQR